ncbi:MAG: YecA family protein [Pseudomonadota bacterium]
MTLEDLDAYLSSNDSPDHCMMLSDLDGFIHGIACSPVFVSAEEWVPVALGGSPDDVPERVLETIVERYADITRGLTSDPPEFSPIFWEAAKGHVMAMDWCEGFLQAVALRSKQWLRLTESGSHGSLMTPIMIHILDDEGNSALGVLKKDLDDALRQAAEEIPESVIGIREFWSKKRTT